LCIIKQPTTFKTLTLPQIYEYIKSDYRRYGGIPKFFKIILNVLLGQNHCFVFSFWLRMYYSKNIFIHIIARMMHRKYGLQIHPKTKIGYGLYIGRRKFSGSFIVKSISTHGRNNVPEHLQTL
jgi:serine O-acetyltransferase